MNRDNRLRALRLRQQVMNTLTETTGHEPLDRYNRLRALRPLYIQPRPRRARNLFYTHPRHSAVGSHNSRMRHRWAALSLAGYGPFDLEKTRYKPFDRSTPNLANLITCWSALTIQGCVAGGQRFPLGEGGVRSLPEVGFACGVLLLLLLYYSRPRGE